MLGVGLKSIIGLKFCLPNIADFAVICSITNMTNFFRKCLKKFTLSELGSGGSKILKWGGARETPKASIHKTEAP